MRHPHGGRHELGQNFLHHPPTVDAIVRLVRATDGPVLEIGAGDGALTRPLAALGRDLLAVELDPHRAHRLARRQPGVEVRCADALQVPLDRPVVVGNIPFHLTTPLLRRLLHHGSWRHAVLLTQWEVARKRAGVGGRTLLTVQTDPWFEVALHGRVPADAFRPRPSVDGGLLAVTRRDRPLVDPGRFTCEGVARRITYVLDPGRQVITLTTFRKQRDNERAEILRARRAQTRHEHEKGTTR